MYYHPRQHACRNSTFFLSSERSKTRTKKKVLLRFIRSFKEQLQRASSSSSSSSSSSAKTIPSSTIQQKLNVEEEEEEAEDRNKKKTLIISTLVSAFLFSTTLLSEESALALLSNPNFGLPRTASAALRRSTPRVNQQSSEIQDNLDDAAYQFRIPQRKPWGQMLSEARKAKDIVKEKKDELFAPIITTQNREDAEVEMENLLIALDRLILACENQDVENFDRWIAKAIEANGSMMVLQVNDLPFLLPVRYQQLPRLTGRALLKFTIRHEDSAKDTFGKLNGEVLKTIDLEITADGFNAPITAGNFVTAVQKGEFDNTRLNISETAIIFSRDDSDSSFSSIPLEVKASNEFEPRYRSPLEVASGIDALPALPLSVNGAVAAMRSASDDGASSSSQFFLFNFDRRQAGLGGVAFEEGEFSTFGYITNGLEYVSSLRKGDVIVKAEVVQGADRLVNVSNPQTSSQPMID